LYKRCYISAVTDQPPKPRTLGTALRHLLELLDGDVAAVYEEEGLQYRPRFTPIMRALASGASIAIRDLAAAARITHSAASQSVARMKQMGLVEQAGAKDGDARERAVRLTRRGKALLPKLEVRWRATNAAAEELDKELSQRLTVCVEEAIAALEARPFKQRIRTNEQRLLRKASK
jgi:DNA-binding MarR family transcriptional regulator